MPGLTPLTQGLHARLQPLLLFYVDAASMIDQDDPDWELLLAVVDSAQGEARVVRSRSVCGMGRGIATRPGDRGARACFLKSFWTLCPPRPAGRVCDRVQLLRMARGKTGAGEPGVCAATVPASRRRLGAAGRRRRARADRPRRRRHGAPSPGGHGWSWGGCVVGACGMGASSPLRPPNARHSLLLHPRPPVPNTTPLAQYEDPTEELQRLRDRLDCGRARKRDWFVRAAKKVRGGFERRAGAAGAGHTATPSSRAVHSGALAAAARRVRRSWKGAKARATPTACQSRPQSRPDASWGCASSRHSESGRCSCTRPWCEPRRTRPTR